MTLPQFQQQAREKFDEEVGVGSSEDHKRHWDFLDELLSDFLLEIEKEVISNKANDINIPTHYLDGWNGARQHVLDAFKRLREVTK